MKKETLQKRTKIANDIMYYIYTHIETNIDIEELSIDLGVSKFHMHRIFKEAFGKNIYESIKSIRLQKASNLLLTNKYSTISNIVNLCGYSSQSSFIKIFKERFEMSPKEWKNGGYKENAGIFCHNNPWISIAETVLGRGNRAFEVYRKICPSYIEEISDIHRTEPYVYSQMIAGADAPGFGEAKNSWLTGTAAWTFINLSQALLGILPGYDGLIVDPCLPETFGDFKVNRHFRGADYHIEIHKPKGVQKGVRWIEVDGERINGNQIPMVNGRNEYHVIVQMG